MKGTPSQGKKSGKSAAMACRRCGKVAYHKRHGVCSSCGFGKSSRIRSYNWKKAGK